MRKLLLTSLLTALLLTACAAQVKTTVTQSVLEPTKTSEPTEFVLPAVPKPQLKLQPVIVKQAVVAAEVDRDKETPTVRVVSEEEGESHDLLSIQAHMVKNDLPKATASRYAKIIMKESKEHDVDPFLILAIIHVETGGTFKYADHPNSHGAIGLMQILKQNAKWMGVSVSDLYDPKTNIHLGTKYLKELQDRFGHDLGITAYNQGEGNVSRGTYNTKYFRAVQKVFKSIEGNDYKTKSSPEN